ncbi:MAG: prepilin-type N-terminal cleavage/methylation domain-containing protein [Acidimicrobiales bacterium]
MSVGTSRVSGERRIKRHLAWYLRRRTNPEFDASQKGFTLIELLIVVTVLPLVIGGLSYGLLTALQIQSGITNRLSDTEDAQVVSSTFAGDVQSASYLTEQQNTTSQCGSGLQILGLEWNPSTIAPYNFQNMVSYVQVGVGTGSSETWSLERQACAVTGGAAISSSTKPSSTVVLSNDLPQVQGVPTFSLASGAPSPLTNWIPAADVTAVTLSVTEPASNYSYEVVGTPQGNSASSSSGTPTVTGGNTTCGFAQSGTGLYANNLCFVDFSSLTGARLAAAESYVAPSGNSLGVCGIEMAAAIPGGFTMYFCLGLVGGTVAPYAMPTYVEAAMGNSVSGGSQTGVPFYLGIPGEPALYQTTEGQNPYNATTDAGSFPGLTDLATNPVDPLPTDYSAIYFSNIEVVNSQNAPATGWEMVSADAENTAAYEDLEWTSNVALSILPNGLPWDTATDPVGNTCGDLNSSDVLFSPAYSQGLFYVNSPTDTEVVCQGDGTNPNTGVSFHTTSGVKNGTAMVAALQPTTLTAYMIGSGLEAITFGLLIAGGNG